MAAPLLPFSSSPSDPTFNPTGNVIFNTDSGTYQIGSQTFTGGSLAVIGPVSGLTTMVFDFSQRLGSCRDYSDRRRRQAADLGFRI